MLALNLMFKTTMLSQKYTCGLHDCRLSSFYLCVKKIKWFSFIFVLSWLLQVAI